MLDFPTSASINTLACPRRQGDSCCARRPLPQTVPQRQWIWGFDHLGHSDLIRLIITGWFSSPCLPRARNFGPSPDRKGRGLMLPGRANVFFPSIPLVSRTQSLNHSAPIRPEDLISCLAAGPKYRCRRYSARLLDLLPWIDHSFPQNFTNNLRRCTLRSPMEPPPL